MDWAPYDYSIVYAEPYRIQQITSNWRLPFPVAVINAITFVIVFLFELIFLRSFIAWVKSFFPPAGAFFYAFVPYFCPLFLCIGFSKAKTGWKESPFLSLGIGLLYVTNDFWRLSLL
ncbi:hypothetical protein IGI96_001745 [Enterococcus sp. DIV0421]|uniref:TcpE family conjugal transfer membrane protein n=1 Tax=Enterococcus sp. DIV0421 TaxID=2774688 RepID=UPI003F296166